MANLLELSSKFVAFFACLVWYIVKQNNPRELEVFRFPSIEINDTYDFIIIGAGSAGSVVANRLSEVTQWNILLVEAGEEEDIVSDTPMLAPTLWNTEKDWNYTTVEQKNTCQDSNGICQYPRGHVLGGSSSINFMCYVRGNKLDFDLWEQQGNRGWSYDDVLPYFLKSEDMRIKSLATSKYHSVGGNLNIDNILDSSLLQEKFISAGEELGFQFNPDYNGQFQTGISHIQYTIRNGSRCSAAKSFLSNIKNRANIHISKSTKALKLTLNDKNNRAESVELKLKNGTIVNVKAKKEIIVSAGAINSPKLLMLSGIGPKEHLEIHGIQTKLNLPVGKNFVDHAGVILFFTLSKNVTLTKNKIENVDTILRYSSYKTGPLSYSLGMSVVGHFSLDKSNKELPDIQTFISSFTPIYFQKPTLMLIFTKLRPKSVGTVELRSSNPEDPPLIDPKYFEHEDDLRDTVQGCQLILEFIRTKALSEFNPQLSVEGSPCKVLNDEEFCRCAVRNYGRTMFHPVSTARMSSDGVVSEDLLIWGIDNLRVVDASIMPNITSGNTNAPVIMIAEKASDMIKKSWAIL